MTSRERMLIAMTNQVPDRVPAAPDISNMVPARLTGKPFWDIYLHNEPPLWRAYIDAVKHFGMDGWFIYGGVHFHCDSKVEVKTVEVSHDAERIVQRHIHTTPAGDLHQEVTYPIADPPTLNVKAVKDIAADFTKLRYLYPSIIGYDAAPLEEMRRELGELGALGACVGYPGFQQWIGMVEGGVASLTYAYYDQPDLIEEWRVMEHDRSVRMMEMLLDARPDFVLLGGSGSITLQSPELFRALSVPTIQVLTRMARQAEIPTMLHSCGLERALVEIMANETDLNCVNPLEVPPMGDCDLAEIKRTFGHKLALMGNLHTTAVMLEGSPADVERAARKCLDDAMVGGGFILSTGDQCGRDTPDANIRKLVDVVKEYGRY